MRIGTANDCRRSCQRNHAVLNAIEIDSEYPRRFLGIRFGTLLFALLLFPCLPDSFEFLPSLGSGVGEVDSGSSLFTFVSSLSAGNGDGSSAVSVIRYTRVVLGWRIQIDIAQYFVEIAVGKKIKVTLLRIENWKKAVVERRSNGVLLRSANPYK